jgi:hypothetical protein
MERTSLQRSSFLGWEHGSGPDFKPQYGKKKKESFLLYKSFALFLTLAELKG